MQAKSTHTDVDPAVNTTAPGIEMGTSIDAQPVVKTLVERRQGMRLDFLVR